MKQIFTLLLMLTFTSALWAQSPEKMSYQATIRNSDNDLVQKKSIGMQISIMQGSTDGIAVYSETHTPMTNTNGLVTLEIGNGTTSDNFSEIDWTAGPYFVKTETDPSGDTDYTIIGTSQLLSVPYALHANTADSIVGGLNLAILDSLSGTNTGDQSISRTELTVSLTNGGSYTDSVNTQSLADVIAINNSADGQIKNLAAPTEANDAATKAYVDSLEAKLEALTARIKALEPPKTGDFRDGGIVFYIFKNGDTGYVLGENHGLVCAVSDQSGGADWSSATTLCSNLTLNSYSDWVLPSQDELNKMYANKATINSASTANGGSALEVTFYWSSTEDLTDTGSAYLQSFDNGNTYSINKILPNRARAIRSF
jgi:hypothetical protein